MPNPWRIEHVEDEEAMRAICSVVWLVRVATTSPIGNWHVLATNLTTADFDQELVLVLVEINALVLKRLDRSIARFASNAPVLKFLHRLYFQDGNILQILTIGAAGEVVQIRLVITIIGSTVAETVSPKPGGVPQLEFKLHGALIIQDCHVAGIGPLPCKCKAGGFVDRFAASVTDGGHDKYIGCPQIRAIHSHGAVVTLIANELLAPRCTAYSKQACFVIKASWVDAINALRAHAERNTTISILTIGYAQVEDNLHGLISFVLEGLRVVHHFRRILRHVISVALERRLPIYNTTGIFRVGAHKQPSCHWYGITRECQYALGFTYTLILVARFVEVDEGSHRQHANES
mmetsp:Transcript_47539/g.83596  ORF Transcript_47539/g.83596 Transcript_47539/m.83596 type:complete len:348 (+) Transcript_47539:2414-3457(+)